MSAPHRAAATGLRGLFYCLTGLAASAALMDAGAQLELPDTGETRPVTAMDGFLVLDGAASGDHMVVVGERGLVLVSRDAGRTWTRGRTSTTSTLTGVSLADDEQVFAVGHEATVLRSRDGGLNWKSLPAAPAENRAFLDVWFEDALRGIAVGAYGLAIETRDGGESWQPLDIGAGDAHLNHISAAQARQIYIAGEAGAVYHTTDGGTRWRRLDPPYSGSFFGSLPLDDRRLYVYGLRGHLFYSDDTGTRWRAVETGESSLLTGAIQRTGHGLLFTGMDGLLLATAKPGAPLIRARRPDRLGIAGALDAGGGALVLFGEFGIQRLDEGALESMR